jgi:hypothetical protein
VTVESILAEIVGALRGTVSQGQLQAYLFGSGRHLEGIWADVDILIVCSVAEDGNVVRGTLSDLCMQYPIDLVIMTAQEEMEFDFIRSQDCRLISSSPFKHRSFNSI